MDPKHLALTSVAHGPYKFTLFALLCF